MRSKPFVSIVIPAYNCARYLPRAVESIADQKGEGHEIIIVDDGSTDDTAEIVRQCQAYHAGCIRYVYQENRGPGAARNHGVSLATGRYVLFLDGDDALMPEALDLFRRAYETHPTADFVWGGSTRIELNGNIEVTPFEPLSADRERNFVLYLRKGPGMIYSGTFLICKSVFDHIRWPEGTYVWADVVFYSHLLARHDGIGFCEPVVRIHKRGDSLQHNIDLIRRDRLKTVGLLFDPEELPSHLMRYREEYYARTLVSLIKLLDERGLYRDAMRLSHYAFQKCPRFMVRPKHLRRYRRIMQKVIWQKVLEATCSS